MEDFNASATPAMVRFREVYETEPWGGPRLLFALDRPRLELVNSSASLEASTDPARNQRVSEGPWAGRGFAELAYEVGAPLLGPRGIALLDQGLALEARFICAENSDSGLRMVKGRAASSAADDSMFRPAAAVIILEAEPKSVFYCSRRRDLAEPQFIAGLRRSPGPELLAPHPADTGQVALVPAGMPYAIGRGVLAFEIRLQEAGAAKWKESAGLGLGRSAENLNAAHVSAASLYIAGLGWLDGLNVVTWLCATDAFAALRLDLRSEWAEPCVAPREGPVLLTGLHGKTLLIVGDETEVLSRGRTFFLPAGAPPFRLNPGPEGASVLQASVLHPDRDLMKPLRARGLHQKEIEGLYGHFNKPRV